MSAAEKVEIKCVLDSQLHARLVNHLPMYGGLAWAVRTTLEKLCDEMDNNPSMQELAAAAVRSTLTRSS